MKRLVLIADDVSKQKQGHMTIHKLFMALSRVCRGEHLAFFPIDREKLKYLCKLRYSLELRLWHGNYDAEGLWNTEPLVISTADKLFDEVQPSTDAIYTKMKTSWFERVCKALGLYFKDKKKNGGKKIMIKLVEPAWKLFCARKQTNAAKTSAVVAGKRKRKFKLPVSSNNLKTKKTKKTKKTSAGKNKRKLSSSADNNNKKPKKAVVVEVESFECESCERDCVLAPGSIFCAPCLVEFKERKKKHPKRTRNERSHTNSTTSTTSTTKNKRKLPSFTDDKKKKPKKAVVVEVESFECESCERDCVLAPGSIFCAPCLVEFKERKKKHPKRTRTERSHTNSTTSTTSTTKNNFKETANDNGIYARPPPPPPKRRQPPPPPPPPPPPVVRRDGRKKRKKRNFFN